MLSPVYTTGELKLLEAADLVEHSATYFQLLVQHFCGAPACIIGHYAAAHPEDFLPNGEPRTWASKKSRGSWYRWLAGYFGILLPEAVELFGAHGCGDSGTDGQKAAAYLRNFVAQRHSQRMSAVEPVASLTEVTECVERSV